MTLEKVKKTEHERCVMLNKKKSLDGKSVQQCASPQQLAYCRRNLSYMIPSAG